MQDYNNTENLKSQEKRRFLNIDFDCLSKIYKHSNIRNLDSFFIFLHSLSTTNNFQCIGVYSEITLSAIVEKYNLFTKQSETKRQILRILEKLEELEIIKIYDRSKNYLITITNHFETLENLLDYVKLNEEEFQFHIHTSRKKQFYQQYKLFDKTEKATVIKLAYAESQILPEHKTEPIDYDPFEETAEDKARRENREKRKNLSFPRR